jgi:predicted  nucleic acid-binding Zn-ribbon protein
MAARRYPARNNHLEEAMALLIRNQAAFVEQIARTDQERLSLQRNTENWQRRTEDWQRNTETRLAAIEETITQMPKTILAAILDQLPKAIKKEIGFKPRS